MRPARAASGATDCAFPAMLTLDHVLLPRFGREFRRRPEPQAWRETRHAHPVAGRVTGDSRQASMAWPGAG